MSELDRIVEAIGDWTERGIGFALATVVGVRGSTYRGLAARQLVQADGTSVGTVSGGCLDNDLRMVAARVIETGRPEVVEFDLTADDEAIWGWGIGCNGATELLVEPASDARALAEQVAPARAGHQPVAIVHDIGPSDPGRRRFVRRDTAPENDVTRAALDAIREGRHRVVEEGGSRHLIEVVGAPPRLVVCGAGHDAAPLVRLAAQMGFEPHVVDDRRQFLTGERFPEAASLIHTDPAELASVISPDRRTYVVLISHNYLRDLAYLRSLIGTDVAYIGALGPGDRLQRLLDDLEEAGVDVGDRDLAKLHGPAGLDVGAEGPDEIALSIMGEVLAVRSGRVGGSLRERKGPRPLRREAAV